MSNYDYYCCYSSATFILNISPLTLKSHSYLSVHICIVEQIIITNFSLLITHYSPDLSPLIKLQHLLIIHRLILRLQLVLLSLHKIVLASHQLHDVL